MATLDEDRLAELGPYAKPDPPLEPIPGALDVVAAPSQVALGRMAIQYWGAIRQEQKLAIASVALFAVSGALEGTALLMLLPLLEQTGVPQSGAGPFTPALHALGVDGRNLVWAAIAGFGIMTITAAATKFGGEATMSLVRVRAEARLRKELTGRLLGMEWSAFLMMRFGEMANSLLWESSQVGAGIQFFLMAIGTLVVTLVYVGLALLLSVRLTLVVMGFALLGLFVLRPMGRRAERHTQGWTAAATAIAYRVTDIFGNLKFFRSTGSRTRAHELFSDGYDEYATWFQRSQVSPLTIRLVYELAALVFVVIMLIVSIAGKSALSASTLVFLAVFMRLSPRVRDLQGGAVQMRIQFPWLTMWEERGASAAAHQARDTGRATPTYAEALRADRVSFAFPGIATNVLEEVSWELRPGESVAFVGESGVGKTTMLDLVSGLVYPQEAGLPWTVFRSPRSTPMRGSRASGSSSKRAPCSTGLSARTS